MTTTTDDITTATETLLRRMRGTNTAAIQGAAVKLREMLRRPVKHLTPEDQTRAAMALQGATDRLGQLMPKGGVN